MGTAASHSDEPSLGAETHPQRPSAPTAKALAAHEAAAKGPEAASIEKKLLCLREKKEAIEERIELLESSVFAPLDRARCGPVFVVRAAHSSGAQCVV